MRITLVIPQSEKLCFCTGCSQVDLSCDSIMVNIHLNASFPKSPCSLQSGGWNQFRDV